MCSSDLFGPLSISEPGTDYVFTASCEGCASIQSEPFTIAEHGMTALYAALPRATVTLGSPVMLEVRALDNFGNIHRSYTGTVTFTSTDPAAVLPEPYTFTEADEGVKFFPVTFNSLGIYSYQDVSVTDGTRTAIAGTPLQESTPPATARGRATLTQRR